MEHSKDAWPPHLGRVENAAVIGSDRDAGAVIDALLSGRSVVVGGPLGAGKSFLLAAVARELGEAGRTPVEIRAADALREVPYGAIDTAADPRATRLREPHAYDDDLIVIVDDAQELDDESVALLLRAVYSRRVTALLALTEPRMSGAVSTVPAVEAINELWLRGRADRVDLLGLQAEVAEALLDRFTAAQPLDSVARAAIAWQADGSRTLLHALTEAACTAVAQARDPIAAISDIAPHSRLAGALHAHLRDLDDEARRALVLVDHARGVSVGDAARFVSLGSLEALRRNGLLHDDGGIGQRLSANRAIARAVTRAWGTERTQRLLDDVLARFIADGGRWWSTPLARTIAEGWLRTAERPADLVGVPDDLVERVVVDAARDANHNGDAVLAAAFGAWGSDLDSPALALEHSFAHALLARPLPPLPGADRFGEDARSRARTIAMTLQTQEVPHETWEPLAQVASERTSDAEVDGFGLFAGWGAMEDMRFGDAISAADAVRPHTAESSADRLNVELLAAMASAYRGDQAATFAALAAAERIFRGPRDDIGDAAERLQLRCLDLAARTLIGADDAEALGRLAYERDDAVREGGPSLAIAGYATALAAVRRGRPLEAVRELDAAMQRTFPVGSSGVGMVQLEIAYALAVCGYAPEARLVLSAVESPSLPSRLFTHALAATAATVAACDGRWEEARTQASIASAMSAASDGAVLRARDLHRQIVLDAGDVDEAWSLLRALAEESAAPIVSTLLREVAASRATGDLEVEPTRVRAHLRWGVCAPQAEPSGGELRPWRHWHGQVPAPALTPRETEIASLVNDGLSNREIAAALFLSVRTVESHIYQARTKVGARTRRELGTIVARTLHRGRLEQTIRAQR